MEPVVVAQPGDGLALDLQLPAGGPQTFSLKLDIESGGNRRWTIERDSLPLQERVDLGGQVIERRRLKLTEVLPEGYHRLHLEQESSAAEALVIAPPQRAYVAGQRSWGVFAPAYALHSARTQGVADLGDMEHLGDWLSGQGGRFLATTPILAAFDREPFDPSPYSPASRLFWNELYLDFDQVPGLANYPAALALLESTAVQEIFAQSRSSPALTYRPLLDARRAVLRAMTEDFLSSESALRSEFERFVAERPLLREYARFRAAEETAGTPWTEWGADASLSGADPHPNGAPVAARYHEFAQWLMDRQLSSFRLRAHMAGLSLYFDLPVGARRDGFDTWKHRDLFALDAAIGAPPDPGFPSGQNWGLPPIRPDASRRQGHQYFIDTVRNQMRHAAMLRLDHIMGLHRLFWIPPGSDEGVYVGYPEEEYFAILKLESARNKCTVVGEDLGTVPRGIRAAMGRHGFQRLYVLQLELLDRSGPLLKAPRASVASLNTHDMPPFASFWNDAGHGAWLALAAALRDLGFLAEPDPDLPTMLKASLVALAASPARFVMINLEDLWLETRRQNLPGTESDDNWRRKHRLSLESMAQDESVRALLESVQSLRHRSAGPRSAAR